MNLFANVDQERLTSMLWIHRFFFTSPPLFGTFYLPGEVTLKWGEVSFIGGEVLRGAVTFVGGEVITKILNDSGRGQGKSRRREGIYWEVCYSI